jgi:hypothetical protein
VFTGDSLMKAREFRLIPSFRKGERPRERGERAQPVRPSLLAPLMVEQAKAVALAKELAAMKPADLERELEADPIHVSLQPPRPASTSIETAGPGSGPVERKIASVWDDAAMLRRLLFSAPTPVLVMAAASSNNGQAPAAELARNRSTGRVPPRHSRGRRRR